MPNFIFFDSFENIFPDKFSIKDLDKNELASDISKISNFDLQIFKSDNFRVKENHKDKIQVSLNKNYNDF
ncbi:MAG: hypothetical protein QJQ54_00405 [Mollicutes bacterium]|nr:MAG: hypothetical protein QJQ54_00405 [Mollicutes bacterium]